MRLTNPKFDAQMERHDHRIDLQRLGICNGNCNQGRQCDCVPDIPQMWDVEAQAPWITALLAGLAILGTIGVCALFAMVRVA
jgi:hypothetical protein